MPLLWKLKIKRALSPFVAPVGFPAIGPRLIVALAADYGNLGDVALTRSLVEFSHRYLPRHCPFILPAGKIFHELRGVSRHVDPEDVIAIIGGGNMGDLYPDLEEARREVVRAFPHNRIISFPQSIIFSSSAFGQTQLVRSRGIYEAHPALNLFAREADSFAKMRASFPRAKVSLVPDTVLSLRVAPTGPRHEPPLVCLRRDLESSLGEARRNSLLQALFARFPDMVESDTVVPGPRKSYPDYLPHLDAFLAQVVKSPFMVTDRLHGMIFCAITGTPCVVLENNNHKIRSTVETWLRDAAFIRLVRQPDPEAVLEAIRVARSASTLPPDLSLAFEPLAKALTE